MKLDELKVDPNSAEWVEAPELGFDETTGDPVQLHLRSLSYPPFRLELAQVQLRLGRTYPGDHVVPPEVMDRENGRLYAKHLLIGWRGIEDAFTSELALAVLTDPAQRRLRDAVALGARTVGQRRAEQVRHVAGNSQPASGGS